MIEEEFKVLAKAMKAVYTSQNFLPDDHSIKVWYQMLKDIDYKVANAAVKKYMLTEKFPPTIAEIRELCADTQYGKVPDWGEGWETTCRLIRKYGSYNIVAAMSEMAKIDDLTYQTVKRIGFKELCMSERPEVDRANFRMIYEQLAEREKIDRQTSQEVRLAISNIQKIEKLGSDTEFVKIGSLIGEAHERN